MSRIEIAHLVKEKLERQEKPDAISTLKLVDCEIGNLLDEHILADEWVNIFTDLHRKVRAAI